MITKVWPLDFDVVVASSTPDGSSLMLTVRAQVVDNGDDDDDANKRNNEMNELVSFIVSYEGGPPQTFPMTTKTDDGYFFYNVINPGKGVYCYHIEAVHEDHQMMHFPNDGGNICFELQGTL
jgi:hypothetical protein